MRRHRGTRRITGPQRQYLAHLVVEARSHQYAGYQFDDTRPNARYLPDLHHLDQLSFDEARQGIEKLKEAKASGWNTRAAARKG